MVAVLLLSGASIMAAKRPGLQGGVLEKTREKTKHPDMFRVLLHNDDYTTMDFVTRILESIFAKSPAEAYSVMMKVHRDGVGEAGVYTLDVAESKVAELHRRARIEGHPLRATIVAAD